MYLGFLKAFDYLDCKKGSTLFQQHEDLCVITAVLFLASNPERKSTKDPMYNCKEITSAHKSSFLKKLLPKNMMKKVDEFLDSHCMLIADTKRPDNDRSALFEDLVKKQKLLSKNYHMHLNCKHQFTIN
eukprot:jgi/Bigna1/129928/aug1.10_g4636